MQIYTSNKNRQLSILRLILIQLLLLVGSSSAFFNFFQQEQHNNEQQVLSYEEQYFNVECDNYVCPYTKQCVTSPNDCDCPFPSSQLKCILPETESNKNPGFICISKPAIVEEFDNEDEESGIERKKELERLYDGVGKNAGALAKVEGIRDCGWVVDVYLGKI